MTSLTFPSLSLEGIRGMRDALAGAQREGEHELSRAVRMTEDLKDAVARLRVKRPS